MAARRKTARRTASPSSASASPVEALVAELRKNARKSVRDQMEARYGIPATHALGVPVATLQRLARPYRGNHELTEPLWKTGIYEARMLVALVGDPERLTATQMERWCRQFDSWAIADTLCFHLFHRSPHAFAKLRAWCGQRPEFVRRAGYALLACVALRTPDASEAELRKCLPLLERGATDERDLVKKAVLWAARGLGERSPALHQATLVVTRRLAESDDPTARWIGRGATRELEKPAVKRRLAARSRRDA